VKICYRESFDIRKLLFHIDAKFLK